MELHLRVAAHVAETQFEYANNGANVPLSPLDNIVHLQSLLHPAGIIAMNTEKLKLAANDTKLTTYDFYSTAENKNDFSEFLKIDVFNRTNDKQLLRGEYDALVAKGYYTDPQQILRDLRHKQTLIGTQEADNMVTDNKILQDYLHVLPNKMREMVFNDKEFTAAKKTNNPAGNPPSGPVAACDIAMQVSMRAFDAAVATYPQGSLPARRQTNFGMLNSIISVGHDDSPNLDLLMNIPTNHAIRRAHQQSHDNHAHVNQLADRIASAVTEGIAGASNLRGEGSVNNDLCALCVGNGNDMDHYEDSLIAAVAESNFDKLSGSEHVGLNSLAQREYNLTTPRRRRKCPVTRLPLTPLAPLSSTRSTVRSACNASAATTAESLVTTPGTASPHEVSNARRSAACNRGEVSLLFPVAA